MEEAIRRATTATTTLALLDMLLLPMILMPWIFLLLVWTKAMEGKRPSTPEEKRVKYKYTFDNNFCVWCYSKDHYGDNCPTAIWNADKPFYTSNKNKTREGNAFMPAASRHAPTASRHCRFPSCPPLSSPAA